MHSDLMYTQYEAFRIVLRHCDWVMHIPKWESAKSRYKIWIEWNVKEVGHKTFTQDQILHPIWKQASSIIF